MAEYKQKLFTFLLEIFFELVLSGVVAFKMFEVKSQWGNPDWVSLLYHIFMLLISIIFLSLSVHFILTK